MVVWIILSNPLDLNEPIDSIHATQASAYARAREMKYHCTIDMWSVAGASKEAKGSYMKVWIVFTQYNGLTEGVYFSKEKADEAVRKELDTAGQVEDSGWSYATEHELQGVPAWMKDFGDEPVFVLRARDSISTWAITSYLHGCEHKGLDHQADEVQKALDEFLAWQANNTDKIKTPDHEHVPVTGERSD